MSEIDSEIHTLRARINALEEQKAVRAEKAEKERFHWRDLGI
jgi:predicted  nucleic acid-binding Zn-ribbon protein